MKGKTGQNRARRKRSSEPANQIKREKTAGNPGFHSLKTFACLDDSSVKGIGEESSITNKNTQLRGKRAREKKKNIRIKGSQQKGKEKEEKRLGEDQRSDKVRGVFWKSTL